MSTGRPDRPVTTARRGSLPTEPEPVTDPARAAGSNLFGSADGEGHDPNSIQGRISRLDNIFAMLSILDSNDDVMLRRLESELMHLEALDLQHTTDELERDFDHRMQLPEIISLSPDPAAAPAGAAAGDQSSSSRGFYDILYSLSEMEPHLGHDRGDDHDHEHDHHHADRHDHDQDDHDDDDDEHDHRLLNRLQLPHGSPLTSAHIDIVSHALDNACIVLGLDSDHHHLGPVMVSEQSRRPSNASEPDREQREGEGEQIEGYEGDRIEINDDFHEIRSELSPNSQVAETRLARIIQTLRAFHANGTGSEELDDFILQAVLQLHAGPSTDNAASSPDHLGNEQMQLYQDCIAAIDDFFEILAIHDDVDDHTDHEHRGAVSADDDAIEDDDPDDNGSSGRHRPRVFSRGSN